MSLTFSSPRVPNMKKIKQEKSKISFCKIHTCAEKQMASNKSTAEKG